MNYPDVCVHEGRLVRGQEPARYCPLSKRTGHRICPGSCARMLTPSEIEIRKGECINRGHRFVPADGWTREDCI